MQPQSLIRSLAAAGTLAVLSVAAFAAPPASKEAALRASVERSGGSLAQVLDFEIVAELDLGNGTVHFIDETVDGEFGLGILELGKVDLGAFYEREATPLEIFLALAPEEAAIPEALYRAHDLARSLDPSLPEVPRDFADLSGAATGADKSVSYQDWTEDTSTCWSWGTDAASLSGAEAAAIGDPLYSYSVAEYYFRQWSQIPSGSATESSIDDSANSVPSGLYFQVVQTPWGNDRALGICITHAELSAGTDWWDCEPLGNEQNTVQLRVRLRGENATSTWYSSQAHTLSGYGQGARYRSSSTQDRRYAIEVRDDSIRSDGCQEQFHAMTRNRNTYIITGPGGLTGG